MFVLTQRIVGGNGDECDDNHGLMVVPPSSPVRLHVCAVISERRFLSDQIVSKDHPIEFQSMRPLPPNCKTGSMSGIFQFRVHGTGTVIDARVGTVTFDADRTWL